MKESNTAARRLTGWAEIAKFLGQPLSTAQRWAKSGMPVHREGRNTIALSEELNRWLSKESGEPVHIAAETGDLSADLKRGLTVLRKQRSSKK